VYSATYTRAAAGRIAQTTRSVEGERHTWAYSYDDAGRLTRVTRDGTPVHTYQYGPNGNRTRHTGPSGTTTATYDDRDRLVQYGNTDYTYNAAGDLTQKSGAQGTTHYDYDAFGNLRGVTQPDGTRITYVIDGENRRVGRKVDGTLEKGWLYQDGLNPVAETDGQGNVTERFVYGTKPNVPAYMIKDGTTYRFITDPRGSVRLVVNTDSGAIAQRINYSPFGKVVNDTNPGFQPFGFAGGLYDPDTGLVRFGARDYDAETGRWTATDPIGFDGRDANLYGYTFNDPINLYDRDGRIGVVTVAVAGAVAIGTAYAIYRAAHGIAKSVDRRDRGLQEAIDLEKRGGRVPAAKTSCSANVDRMMNDYNAGSMNAMKHGVELGQNIPGTLPTGGPPPTGVGEYAVGGAAAALMQQGASQ